MGWSWITWIPKSTAEKRPRKELDVDAQSTSGNEDAGTQSSRNDRQQQESQTGEALLAMATTSVQSSQEVHVVDETVPWTRTDLVV